MSMIRLSLVVLALIFLVSESCGFVRVRVGVRVRVRARIRIGKRSLGGKANLVMKLNPCDFTSFDIIYRDSIITKEEIEILFENGDKAKTDPVNQKQDYYADEIFKALDIDGNEEVTPEEFKEKAPDVIAGCKAA
uniref:EF-hand domain-containing protein n=1 Tax=Pinctada fucata TaxID=50426 RepID=A0A194ANR5_PINFU